MSKALLRSIWTSRIRSAGFFLLKPAAMDSVKSCSAETVECCALNPCWNWGMSRVSFRVGKSSRSNIFIDGQRRDTSL